MKYAAGALVCVASLCMIGAAQADQTQIGAAAIIVSGTHTEPGSNVVRGSAPAPVLFVDHRSKRWELYAEGVGGIGPQRVNGTNGVGLQSVLLSNFGASVRYALTSNTAVGVGETLYNQRSIYQEPGFSVSDSSRLAGAQYAVIQSLRRSPGGELSLSIAYNPHLSANLFQSYSNAPVTLISPESGTQIDAKIETRRHLRRTTLYYGVRYINLSMHFVNGELADRNAFVMPFIGVSTALGY